MIELAVVIFILATFAFPINASAGCLGLYTTWLIYRCYEAFKNQPLEGKRILSITWVAFSINFVTSVALSVLLALLVYIFIFDYFYLLLFNFIFCFLISMRWFNFSYKYFQRLVIGNNKSKMDEEKVFVVCKGFKNKSSFGMTPAFIDAGYLSLEDNNAAFEGTFFKKTFNPKLIHSINKKSLEKIEITINFISGKEPNIFLITLKDQFYPFRSRSDRDRVASWLSTQVQYKQT